jgi:tRNA dimethylallyltransferase
MSLPDSTDNLSPEVHKIPLVVIIGPTAVGKSEMAIKLAEYFNGEIVSADSRLFYRGMSIGTAKPTYEERQRVPHHLIDVASPDQPWSLALFQADANRVIRSIYKRHRLPFLVGGTGQFVHALIKGWKIPPIQPNLRLRTVLDEWGKALGADQLHAKLAVLDPPAARAIDPSNVRRTVRALEVILTTGNRFSEQRQSGFELYQQILLGLTRPRAELYQRIDDRIKKMLDAGFIDEVRDLLEAGYSAELPTMTAIGYGEIAAYLNGKTSLDEAIVGMKRRTREFVRRQANWFKENDPNIQWFYVNGATIDDMVSAINKWLASIQRDT